MTGPQNATSIKSLLFSRLVFLVFLLFLATPPILSQELNRHEKKILSIVEANHAQAVAFLEKSVNINSGTLNLPGVKEAGEQYQLAYQALGFETSWIEMPENINRAGHLIAEITGNKGKRLLLIGHLDTVFEKDSPFQKWESDGNEVKGPGVADMKGGNVVMLFALKALQQANLTQRNSDHCDAAWRRGECWQTTHH